MSWRVCGPSGTSTTCPDDPPALAAGAATEAEALAVYRRVRDEIRAFVDGHSPPDRVIDTMF